MTGQLAPRFSAAQRRQLQQQDGVTPAQLLYLERALVNVAFELQRSAPLNDVRDLLDDLQRHMRPAAKLVARLQAARRPAPGAEALGHLNAAGAQVGWQFHDEQIGHVGYPVGSEIILLAAAIADHARKAAPNRRRTATVSSWRAIDFIKEALDRPDDPRSRAAAAALQVSRSVPKLPKPSFSHLAGVIFEAATGKKDANPDRSIRQYLARRKAAET